MPSMVGLDLCAQTSMVKILSSSESGVSISAEKEELLKVGGISEKYGAVWSRPIANFLRRLTTIRKSLFRSGHGVKKGKRYEIIKEKSVLIYLYIN